MDKSLSIIFSATVLIIVAAAVVALSLGEIDLSSDADSISSQVCEQQAEQFEDDEITCSAVTSNCVDYVDGCS